MAFCRKCGSALTEGKAFCGSCGVPVVGGGTGDSSTSPRTLEWPGSSGDRDGLRVGPHDDPDRYELVELRSRGGEGELWRSILMVDGVPLPVAVKVINESNADRIDDWSVRWKQQAEILRTLDHPGLVKVRDTFEGPLPHPPGKADMTSRSLFLVMNWVKGESLVEWVAHHQDRDLLESARVVARIAAALDYLHSGASTGKPVLHRDVKPANVLIDGPNACLVDFGFARLMSGEPMTLAGTPYYLAPEVVGGGTFTEASDRYSLGATAYYAIVGEPPAPGDYAGMRAKLSAVRGAEGRVDLADHVLAMVAQDPVRRPVNTVEWAASLAAGAVSGIMPAPPSIVKATPKRGRGKLVATLVVLAVVLALAAAAAAYVFVFRDNGDETASQPSPAASTAVIASPSPSPLSADAYSPSPAASPSESPVTASPSSEPAPVAGDGLVHMNLSLLADPVDDGYIEPGEYIVQKKPYINSLGAEANEWTDGGRNAVEYNVPSGFDQFRATIGMDDHSVSSARATFQVLDPISGANLLGGSSRSITLKVNQAKTIKVSLPPGILRIKLITVTHASSGDWTAWPVWGDAEFTGPEGTAQLPTPQEMP